MEKISYGAILSSEAKSQYGIEQAKHQITEAIIRKIKSQISFDIREVNNGEVEVIGSVD